MVFVDFKVSYSPELSWKVHRIWWTFSERLETSQEMYGGTRNDPGTGTDARVADRTARDANTDA